MNMKRLSYFLVAALMVAAVISCKKDSGKESDGGSKLTAPEAVDLGLSVLWADRNIGAEDAMRVGYHFAWGETNPRPKDTFAERNYVFEKIYAPMKLTGQYDAANVLLGNGWRMPTKEECLELSSLEVETIKDDGVPVGIKLTGNGNSITIPFPDPDGGLNLINLWTSGRTADPLWAEICYDINSVSECRREYTNPIRAVKDK